MVPNMSCRRRGRAKEVAARTYDAMKARGWTQTAVCIQLSLSPVYLSMWLKSKDGMPKQTRELYTSAIELWLDDVAFAIRSPQVTNTNPTQVPRPAKTPVGTAVQASAQRRAAGGLGQQASSRRCPRGAA